MKFGYNIFHSLIATFALVAVNPEKLSLGACRKSRLFKRLSQPKVKQKKKSSPLYFAL
jgi:hypothetical protein